MDWASVSLWNLDSDLEIDHSATGIMQKMNGEQNWPIEIPTKPASFALTEEISPDKDAPLVLGSDIMNHHRDGSTLRAQGHLAPITPSYRHRHSNPHQHMYHYPSPSSLGNPDPSSFTGESPTFTSSESTSGLAEALEPTQPLLHVAVRSRNCSTIGLLLRRGAATVGDRNGNGATALHIATELRDEATVSMLLHYGADIGVRDGRGQDALHLAVAAGHTGIVKLMLDTRKMTSQDPCSSPC